MGHVESQNRNHQALSQNQAEELAAVQVQELESRVQVQELAAVLAEPLDQA